MLPSQGYVSISRRPPDVEDYIDILRRHKAWLIGPAFTGLVIAVVVAFTWTSTFISQAVLRITPPAVPENLVPSNFNMQMGERINQMQQEIESRQSLAGIIQSLDLYKTDRAARPIDDVVERMRRDIKIDQISVMDQQMRPHASAFQIRFSYWDRHKAKAVVDQLVGKFTERSVKVSTNQSNVTTQFLSSEGKAAKDELDRLDRELAAFRAANAGRLPEQVPNNIQALNALSAQLGGVTEALNRDNQDKLLLDTTLQGLKNQLASVESHSEESGAAVKNDRLVQLNHSILDADAKLSALREVYKDDHPDVRSWKAQVDAMKRERDALEQQEVKQDKTKVKRPLSTLVLKEQENLKLQIEQLNAQIKAKDIDIKERLAQQNQINKSMQIYQSRIQPSPQSEQRYAQLLRDEAMAKAKYEDLSRRQSISEMASNLEAQKGGENLEVLDPASLPDSPSAPNRWMIVGAGTGVGVLLGLLLVAAREVKDTSLKNLKDVRAYTNLPVLSSVPLLENAIVVQQQRRLAWLGWSTAVIAGLIAMSSSMYYHYFMNRT